MPYIEKLALTGASSAELGDEIHGWLSAALDAHPSWTRVTAGYTGNTNFPAIDVWANDGTTDGYPWYLVVAKGNPGNVSYAGRVLLGGALEYDPGTATAWKATTATAAAVTADGWVADGAGDRAYPLSSAATAVTGALIIGGNSSIPVPVKGNWVRGLVTGRTVWVGYGTATTLTHAHGVGTYTQMHSEVQDQRPLAMMATTSSSAWYSPTVWRSPAAPLHNGDAACDQWVSSTTTRWTQGAASALYGQVGGDPDPLHGGPVGARLAVQRVGGSAKQSTAPTYGGFLGVAPANFLVFGRTTGVQIGDTITVGGDTYVSVDTPAAAGGLFVNMDAE